VNTASFATIMAQMSENFQQKNTRACDTATFHVVTCKRRSILPW